VFARSQVEVQVPPGRILLEVAEEHGIPIDSLCRGGTCGTCKTRLLAGQPSVSTWRALSEAERDAGFVLTCSAVTTPGQRIVLDA